MQYTKFLDLQLRDVLGLIVLPFFRVMLLPSMILLFWQRAQFPLLHLVTIFSVLIRVLVFIRSLLRLGGCLLLCIISLFFMDVMLALDVLFFISWVSSVKVELCVVIRAKISSLFSLSLIF